MRGSVHRCLQSDVGVQISMGVSSTGLNTSGSESSQFGSGDIHFDGPEVGESLLEGRLEVPSVGSSIHDSQPTPSSPRISIRKTPATGSADLFGGLEDTGWSPLLKSWKAEDRSLLESAWRKSSLKTYYRPWKDWLEWCSRHKFSPMKPRTSVVAGYLSYLFRIRKLSPATIKVHKSVIVSFGDPLNEGNLSSTPMVATC